MLDWRSAFSDRQKIPTLVFGLVALFGSVAVLGITIVRVNNLQSTINRPKAGSDPMCSQPPPGCCTGIQSSYEFSKCSWDGSATGGSRGWCTKSQCGGAALARSAANGGNQNCGLFRQTYCQSGGWCNNNDDCYNGETCNSGTCGSGGTQNSAYYSAIYPTGGVTTDSVTPTFQWNANTSGISYNNICIGTNSSCNGLACNWTPSTSDRSYVLPSSANLLPNTDYYWVLYGQPGNPAPGTGCQHFRTPYVAPPTKSCSVTLLKSNIGLNEIAVATISGSVSSGADSVYFWMSKQITATGQNATAQIVPRPITNPPLVVPTAGDNWDPNHTYGGGDIYQYYTKVCDTSGLNCTGTVTINSLPAGNYNVFCSTGLMGTNGDCSGQPLCTYKGGALNCNTWKSCAADNSDVKTLTVSPCNSGLSSCSATCVDLQSDPNNCGACGKVCATGTEACSAGVCVSTCPTGQTACSGTCKDLQSDPNNCGTCGTACTVGEETCVAGACALITQADKCWGNDGEDGKCYDCNGDGVVNVLDFSCFSKNYGKGVTQ